MAQASKRKRKTYNVFRAVNLSTICKKCGKKIRTQHHFLCHDCWKKRKRSKGEEIY